MKRDFVEDLRSLPDLNDRQRYGLAKLLDVVCNFGAGDALAGLMLKNIGADYIKAAAKLLKIKEPPSGSGPTVAMMLLSCKSDDPVIADMLRELDTLSSSGQGCDHWSAKLQIDEVEIPHD